MINRGLIAPFLYTTQMKITLIQIEDIENNLPGLKLKASTKADLKQAIEKKKSELAVKSKPFGLKKELNDLFETGFCFLKSEDQTTEIIQQMRRSKLDMDRLEIDLKNNQLTWEL